MIGAYLEPRPVSIYPAIGGRSSGYTIGDDFAREALTPTDWPLLYTKAATGTDTSAMSATINRYQLITDVNNGDNVDLRTSGYRFQRNFTNSYSGMSSTSILQLDIAFVTSHTTVMEGFVGIVGNVSALTAPPTTTRHMGVYWDISAGANFMLTSANGTTQVTTDTLDTVDVNKKILRITWTGEDTATIELLTAAGALSTASATQTVAALNGSSDISYELHWFAEVESGAAARQLNVYGWRAKWT